MNKKSEGVISMDQCGLPPKPTSRPPFKPPTATTTPTTTTTTTTTTTKPPYIPPTTSTTTTTATTTTTKPLYIRRDIAFDGRSSAVFPPDSIDWDNSLPTDDFDGSEIKIEVKLTTEAEEGLILFQGDQSYYFISLGGMYIL
jgi:hypothetical protein